MKDGEKRAEYRVPKGMGAAERARRKFCESKAKGDDPKYIFEPWPCLVSFREITIASLTANLEYQMKSNYKTTSTTPV